MIGPKALSELTDEERKELLERWRLLEAAEAEVAEVVKQVASKGDDAVLYYTKLFDGVELSREELVVQEEELKRAARTLSESLLRALEKAAEAIRKFHEEQLPPEVVAVETWPGCLAALARKAVERVGLYVPGGLHPYPSTALMLAVPARVAGCKRVIACTPPSRKKAVDPLVAAALLTSEVDVVYRIGGPQAIAAMAYGTETVERVDKIFGPGGPYVTAAKKLVFGRVGVDMLAGPSEVLVLADDSSEPGLVALDMLAQLEHGPGTCAVLVALSEKLAAEAREKLLALAKERGGESLLERRLVAFLHTDSAREAVQFVNEFAPEHVEVLAEDPLELTQQIENAGSVLVGKFAPASLSDYATGANHVLPTASTARYRGALTVYDFVKFVPVQVVSKSAFFAAHRVAVELAKYEGMALHALSLEARLRGLR